jgi:transposase
MEERMPPRAVPATTAHIDALPCIHPNAAGLDIGADQIYACVPSDRDARPVRAFATFTADLHALADWLEACGIDTVAMESTGIYWLAIYEILQARGIQVFLVNARQIKLPPGRKSDWKDCQWIQRLHMLGLLHASFRPDAEMALLRAYLRHRAELIQHRAPHILHLQKALHQMNIQLDRVLADVTGTTGMAILRAIVAGERDPLALAQLRNPGCKSSEEKLAKAMEGTWQAPYLFVLKQALELYDFYTQQLAACDAEIECYYGAMKPRFETELDPTALPGAKPGSKSKNKPSFNARAELARVVGIDLVAVTGLSASSVQTIISEIGTDMSKFPTAKHFGSWLGLAPHNDISGGKVLRSRTRKVVNRAAQAFRQAAQCVGRSDTALGAYYRRMRARLGPQQATVATAYKIARIVYTMLKERKPFQEMSADAYDQQYRERELKYLQRKAAKLGFDLAPKVLTEPVPS